MAITFDFMPRIRAASIDEHKELTRRAILDSAEALIAELGTAEIPLGHLTSKAGIGRTTFYDYFVDRDDVIASLVEEELPSVIEELIESVGTESVPDRLVDLVVAMIGFIVDNPVLGIILHREVPKLGPDAQKRIMTAHAELSREMAAAYRTGVADGTLRKLDPELVGRLFQDLIMSAAKTVIASAEPRSRAATVTSDIRVFLLAGLALDVENP